MPLTKAQRNRVFQAVQEQGLDPTAFRWESSPEALVHEATGSTFWFELRPVRAFWAAVRANLPTRFGRDPENTAYVIAGRPLTMVHVGAWGEREEVLHHWLSELRAEIAEPDLWATLAGTGDGQAGVENTPFTPEEQQEIRAKLDAVLEEVQAQGDLSAEQIRNLEARLEYLKQAAGRLGRIDWRNLLAGVMLTAITEAILPPETTKQVLTTIVRELGHLYFRRMFPELPMGS